jgi:hypothetical protein
MRLIMNFSCEMHHAWRGQGPAMRFLNQQRRRFIAAGTSQEQGRAVRTRGNGLGTEAGIENVSVTDGWLFYRIRQYAEAMHTAEHLAECQIQRTQIGLAGRGFAVVLMIMHMTFVRMCVMRATARVPGGVYQRALLRDEQSNNTQIMEKMPPHSEIINPRTDFAGGTIYLVTVSTASVSR